MGKGGKKATVGYWYRVAYHAGLTIGPIDAFLEFRGGDKTAWSGALSSSGTISINAPNLWGGEKDQGGIVGDVDVMFGEATQSANAYLLSAFGSQVPAWRGIASLVFKGGKYGAMNPYPQKPSYKFQRIVKGWDNDVCWYPDTAAIAVGDINVSSTDLGPTSTGWRYKVISSSDGSDYSAANYDDSAWSIGQAPFASQAGHPYAASSGFPTVSNTLWPLNTKIWVRRTFNANAANGFVLTVFADNYATVWVNGQLVLPRSGSTSDPSGPNFTHQINVPASVVRQGSNSIAVLAEDFGQYSYVALRIEPTASAGLMMGMNPAHILYYARTQQDMGREPIANMSDASFRAAADWYYAQGVGLCTEYDPAAESLDDFIARIEKVAGCSMSRDPVDGLWHLDVANGVYDLASLPILTDDDILDFAETPSLLDSAINSKSVQFFDPVLKESITTAPVQAMALVDAFGTIFEQVSYPEVPTNALALRLADRDLRASVTPTRTFDITATRLPYSWRVSTYFRLQSAKRGIADMVCILAEKSSGTLKSGAIKLTASQDIYSLSAATFVDVEHGVDTRPSQIPVPVLLQAAMEAPYIEVCSSMSRADLAALPSDVGYLMAVASDPSISQDFSLTVSSGGDYAETAHGDWCATAVINQASAFNDTAFVLSSGIGLSNVAVGMPALWGSEIVRVDAINASTGAVTFGRACADTVPVKHAAGERVWFYATGAADDATEYTAGETVSAKLLTNTGSQQLAGGMATAIPVTFASRAARPYPPGQVRINGQVDPVSVIGAITVTGVGRDRVQQADQLIDTEMAVIGPEAGSSFTVRYYLNGTLVNTDTGLATPASTYTPSGAGLMHVEFESARSGLTSYQMHVREFIVGQPLVDETGDLIVTEDNQPIIMG